MIHEQVEIINVTKHPIHIVDETEKTICFIERGSNVARVIGSQKEKKEVQEKNAITIYEITDGEQIIDLPEQRDNCIYIVSRIVLEKMGEYRKDLYAPLMQYSRRQQRKICIGLYQLKGKGEIAHEVLSNSFSTRKNK